MTRISKVRSMGVVNSLDYRRLGFTANTIKQWRALPSRYHVLDDRLIARGAAEFWSAFTWGPKFDSNHLKPSLTRYLSCLKTSADTDEGLVSLRGWSTFCSCCVCTVYVCSLFGVLQSFFFFSLHDTRALQSLSFFGVRWLHWVGASVS